MIAVEWGDRMSLKSATEQIKSQAKEIELEQENTLLKAALIESKEAYQQYTEKTQSQMSLLIKKVEALTQSVDESNKAAGQSIRDSLETGLNGSLRNVTDTASGFITKLEKGTNDVLTGLFAIKLILGSILVLSLLCNGYVAYKVSKASDTMSNDIDNMRDVITKDAGYWFDEKTQQLYIKHKQQQK